MEAVECGAASLAMVLGSFGRFVPLEELRLECGVSRDGSKASNILKAARKYGLQCKGYKKEPAQLRSLPFPQIAFWNFNHFVVVEGFGKGKVYLNDPGSGPRVVTEQEFDEAFTGVVLIFEKGPEFKRGGHRKSVLKALASRLPGSRASIVYLISASLGLALPGLVMPAFSRIFLDQVLVGGQQVWIRPLILAMAVTTLFRIALTWLQQSSLLRLESKLAISGSARFFWHILRLPNEFFGQRYAGDVAARVDINDKIAGILAGDLATNAVNVLMAVFYAALLYRYDHVLAAVAVIVAIANLMVLQFVARKRKDAFRSIEQDQGKFRGVAMAGLQMIENFKATGSEGEFFSLWAGYHAKVLNGNQKIGSSSLMLSMAPMLLMALNSVAILWLGGLRVIDGLLTMGMLFAFQTLVAQFLEPVNGLLDLGAKLQEAEAGMNRVDDVLEYPVSRRLTADSGSSEIERRLDGYLELRNITFGYSKLDPPLIKDFSLSMKPGQSVALVGGSGSGKSTVAKLVAGLYDPWEGEILFDGKPRSEWDPTTMARSFAMVDQDIAMFEGTIRENLTLWDESVAEPVIVRAAEDACIHDDIIERKGGYDFQIEEGGRNFSGGQRQRLEIARALTVNPRILVLDEATSALDPATEKLIVDALRRRACTCLVVAHRLSTIRDCDEIIMLERGQVVERGTHEQLVEAGGAYAGLISAT